MGPRHLGLQLRGQWLANRGYLCVQVNFRGSTGYGKDFVNAGDKEWGAKMHDDLLDGVDWVVAQGYADRSKVAIYGGSYGGYAALAGADLARLSHESELKVARTLAEWPRVVEIAAKGYEPHRIAFYLYDLAGDLHSLWNRGNDDASLRFVQEGDPATTAARLALVRAVAVVIASGLGILGVTPVNEMR